MVQLQPEGNMAFLFSLETWILLITLICLFVRYGSRTHGVFEKLGIPGPKPKMYWGTVARYHDVYYVEDTLCAKKYGRVWGIYEFRKPILAVTEPDMLRTILVKECFTYFTNRRNLILNGDLYDAVTIAEDGEWRRIRNTLSPIFTTGRIKEMFSIMKHHSRKLIDKMKPMADNGEVIQVKDFFGAVSMDTMLSCLFSVDTDVINNLPSPFITHISKLFKIPIPLFIFQAFFPFSLPLLKFLGFSFFSKSSSGLCKAVVEKMRAERVGSSRQGTGDLLQHMINSQNGGETHKEKGLSDHEIISQVTMLLFAGFETTATTLSLLAYSLAIKPDIMEKLQMEIDSTFPNKAPVQYDVLMQMEYLDAVVNESLRLYPPAGRLERVAKETVRINDVTIPKDMMVMIPVYALHRDPELWPDPEDFRPERFSKENKQNIKPYVYLPFGAGPRNCLGTRFALLMIKLVLVEVLQNFSFSICEETEIPLVMDPQSLVGPLRPIKLRLMTRSVASEDVDDGNQE